MSTIIGMYGSVHKRSPITARPAIRDQFDSAPVDSAPAEAYYELNLQSRVSRFEKDKAGNFPRLGLYNSSDAQLPEKTASQKLSRNTWKSKIESW
jgi:hypothetical protein